MENSDETTTTESELKDLRHEIAQGIAGGKYTWRQIQEAIVAKTRETATTTDHYVHDNPWQVVGWAAGLGFVLGLLMAPHSDY